MQWLWKTLAAPLPSRSKREDYGTSTGVVKGEGS